MVTQILLIILFIICGVLLLYPLKIERLNKILLITIYVVVISLVICRPRVMADYNNYEIAFEGLDDLRFEPSFNLIRMLASLLGNTVFWGFVIYALMSVSMRILYISKFEGLTWGMLMVYFSNILVAQDMIAIRAAVASSLLLYTVDCYVKQEKLKTFCLLLCAVLFHYSAAFFFILFIISSEKVHRLFYLSILFVCHVLAYKNLHLNQFFEILNFIDAMDTLNNIYMDNPELNVFNLLHIGHIAICCFFWTFVQRIQKYDERALTFLKLYTIGLCAIPLFAEMIAVSLRLSEMFLSVEIILVPIGFFAIFENKIVSRLLILSYSIVIFYFTITNLQYWNPDLY